MWDKILSHPMTILALFYAGCVLTAIWFALTQRKSLDNLRQKPIAKSRRMAFQRRRRLSGVASRA